MSNIKGMTPGPARIPAEVVLQPSDDFVLTPSIRDLTERALAYLSVGYAVHLSGPAGTGKTTLAMHIAAKLGRPCTLLHGDDEMRSSDLVGRDAGYRKQSVRDNYVSSILKTEETVTVLWNSNRLTTAAETGHTLIYDEFTRSPPTANNVLLSVLEEKILNIPSSGQERGYVQVHPNFRAIFTSNPSEYIGVHKTQDALLDRMITLEVSYQDRETEIAIVQAKSKRNHTEASAIVDIVRALRERLGGNSGPTIRAALAIATIADYLNIPVDGENQSFVHTCLDVLYFNATRQSTSNITRKETELLIRKHAAPGPLKASDKPSIHLSTRSLSAVDTVIHSPNEFAMEANLKLEESGRDSRRTSEASQLAEIALDLKNLASPSSYESLAMPAKTADQTAVNALAREQTTRTIPRPPAFEMKSLQNS